MMTGKMDVVGEKPVSNKNLSTENSTSTDNIHPQRQTSD
jgi:hypothetical protein